MTPVVLFILLLSLTAVPPGAADEGDDGDSSEDVSRVIARANEGISTSLIYDDIAPNMERNAARCTARGCKWPKSGDYVKVPYTISSKYSTDESNFIIKTLESFHNITCIRFQKKSSKDRSYLRFVSGFGCWSFLGRQPFGQRVSLNKKGCLRRDVVHHEVLHALGFHHEEVRSDRDKYVSIVTKNIKLGRGRFFKKMQTNNLETPYDFGSVMHSSNFIFSKNGQPTIVAKDNPKLDFGLVSSMSPNDIARVNKLYKCKV